MSRPVYLADNTIDDSELSAIAEWITSGNRLTKGEETLKLESAFRELYATNNAIFVNSGSSANLLMVYSLREAGLLRNSVAIAPAVSWVTTVSPFMQLGFETHLCDCSADDLGVDLDHFEYLLKKHKPSVACLVHVLGHANKLEEIVSLCNDHNVVLLEDTCEALGSRYREDQFLGTYGEAGSFSFYYGHHLSTIEGGMVITSNNRLANIMLSIRSHGWSRDVSPDFRAELSQKYSIDRFRELYTFYYPGFNLRSTDLQARIGLSQLVKFEHVNNIRSQNFSRYQKNLGDFFSQSSRASPVSSFAYGTLVANRLEVFDHLRKNGIESRPLICGNIGRHPFWTDKYGQTPNKNADHVHEYGIYLPNHANLPVSEVDRVCQAFLDVARPIGFAED